MTERQKNLEFVKVEGGWHIHNPEYCYELKRYDPDTKTYKETLSLKKGVTTITGPCGNQHGSEYEGYYLSADERFVVFFHTAELPEGPLKDALGRLVFETVDWTKGCCNRTGCGYNHGRDAGRTVTFCDTCGCIYCKTCVQRHQSDRCVDSLARVEQRCPRCTRAFPRAGCCLAILEHETPNQPVNTTTVMAVRVMRNEGPTYDVLTFKLDEKLNDLDFDWADPEAQAGLEKMDKLWHDLVLEAHSTNVYLSEQGYTIADFKAENATNHAIDNPKAESDVRWIDLEFVKEKIDSNFRTTYHPLGGMSPVVRINFRTMSSDKGEVVFDKENTSQETLDEWAGRTFTCSILATLAQALLPRQFHICFGSSMPDKQLLEPKGDLYEIKFILSAVANSEREHFAGMPRLVAVFLAHVRYALTYFETDVKNCQHILETDARAKINDPDDDVATQAAIAKVEKTVRYKRCGEMLTMIAECMQLVAQILEQDTRVDDLLAGFLKYKEGLENGPQPQNDCFRALIQDLQDP